MFNKIKNILSNNTLSNNISKTSDLNTLSNTILKEKADKAIDSLIYNRDLGAIQDRDLGAIQEWRGKHLSPMIQLKDFVIQETEKLQIKPVFVSARLKMITTIIDKIKTGRHKKLSTMQDLGGVRIVFDNHKDLYTYYNKILKSKAFKILRTKNYIKEPKETGYRGIHIVYDIDGYNIELQLRTEGQHIWASTVETVGWHLKQDLKSGKGDLEWVQFFQETGDIFCDEICYHNIKYIQSLTINDANVVEYLKSIHNDEKIGFQLSKLQKKYIVLSKSRGYKIPSIVSTKCKSALDFYSKDELLDTMEFCSLVSLDHSKNLLIAYPCFFSQTKQFTDYLEGLQD